MATNTKIANLEKDLVTQRQELADTIDELAYRLTPQSMLHQTGERIRNFFVDDEGQVRVDHVAMVAGTVVGFMALSAIGRRRRRRRD